eukprot:7178846-Lingulodinium_polyedra.AAC.1
MEKECINCETVAQIPKKYEKPAQNRGAPDPRIWRPPLVEAGWMRVILGECYAFLEMGANKPREKSE